LYGWTGAGLTLTYLSQEGRNPLSLGQSYKLQEGMYFFHALFSFNHSERIIKKLVGIISSLGPFAEEDRNLIPLREGGFVWNVLK